LVDEDVVHQKVSDTVGQDAKANRVTIPDDIAAYIKKRHTYNGIENKKGIIALKPGIVFLMVMVLV